MSTQENGSSVGSENKMLGTSSKDATELFDRIKTIPFDPASSSPSNLAGHRRDRYEGNDASLLTIAPSNNVEAAPKEPVNSGKFGFDPRNATSSVRTGHLFRTIIPADPRHSDKPNYPVAVGYCARGCGVHCNQNPLPRECTENPAVEFKNNQMTMTYKYVSPNQ